MVLANLAKEYGGNDDADSGLMKMLNKAYQFGIQSTYAPSDEVDDEDDTIPAESLAMMDAQDNCTHPNMGFQPDVFEDGKRVSKHHWYCEDCGYLQVG